ncbi:MAG: hypothetical protein E7521_06395 [Ruminococcaceae bacterium]|nr:hypothetical protein [Oscillospiraceae bacterium]
MDDLSQKLAELLNDPDTMSRVQKMAENILDTDSKKADNTPPLAGTDSLFGEGIDPLQLSKIMSIVSKLKSNNLDNRSQLLLALKPHLSAPRREKVDTAIKLLKLIDLLPLLRESGMFEL